MSHSTRVRGLKSNPTCAFVTPWGSHSTRVRGLKSLAWQPFLPLSPVALYTSAWIEITTRFATHTKKTCRTLHECVDWNKQFCLRIIMRWCRTLHECVDWNRHRYLWFGHTLCRTLHECVDWNNSMCEHHLAPFVSHSTRVRGLKYRQLDDRGQRFKVALYTSAWIEIGFSWLLPHPTPVALYTSAWIEISTTRRSRSTI